jgi:hypothetical protein
MRLGMRAHIGEADRILDARNLPGIRIRPTPALFQLNHVIVEEQIDRDGGFK